MKPSVDQLVSAEQSFVDTVNEQFAQANLDFARSYYLFASARLEKAYNSSAIYQKYPLLHDEATFRQLKTLFDRCPEDEAIKRLFVDTLGTYIGNQLSEASDELTNLKNNLSIDVSGLELTDKKGNPLTSVLYEDTPELFKTTPNKVTRSALYDRVNEAYNTTISPKFLALFERENKLMAELGYSDIVAFYAQSSGHPLIELGQQAKTLVEQTESWYRPAMGALYQAKVGQPFETAKRSDISYVLHGKTKQMAEIDALFTQDRLVPLAQKTFDTLGLDYSHLSSTIDCATRSDYDALVNDPNRTSRILLDVANREGKRSRAYVYPAQVPHEVYLSVKPEGGLDDFSAFFHESGHALHFANVREGLSYALALMGNNTTTESYAYLMQNLFLNRYWLVKFAGLTPQQANELVERLALADLYMLRRYASKLQFELHLYSTDAMDTVAPRYETLLTQGTGFFYDGPSWTRDVDAGFYVADYFTAWTLEAQLREVLQTRFGSAAWDGEDWVTNPKAGEFLQSLWVDGNIAQHDLSTRLGYGNPADVGPLLRLMKQNLHRSQTPFMG